MGFMQLESPVFRNNGVIPDDYTGNGKELSPPLDWTGVPTEAQELVLICEDLDAVEGKPYTHWVVYNIPANRTELPEGASQNKSLKIDFEQGRNSANRIGYVGPTPPAGTGTHRYRFKLYALDTKLHLRHGATKQEVLDAMADHVIAEATYVGMQRYH